MWLLRLLLLLPLLELDDVLRRLLNEDEVSQRLSLPTLSILFLGEPGGVMSAWNLMKNLLDLVLGTSFAAPEKGLS
nr:hypothetical protein BaRGS_020467 [Batillaria attramentaria]